MRELATGRLIFDENAIYIVGNAKSSQNNPITQLYGQFFIGFVVEKTAGKILACGISASSRRYQRYWPGSSVRPTPESSASGENGTRIFPSQFSGHVSVSVMA